MSECLQINSLNIKYLVFVLYSIEYKLKRNCKSLYFVFIYILHPNFIGIGVYTEPHSILWSPLWGKKLVVLQWKRTEAPTFKAWLMALTDTLHLERIQ